MVKSLSLESVADSIGAQLKLGGAHPGRNVEQSKREIITGIAPLGAAKPGEISHLTSSSYRKFLGDTRATAVILVESDLPICPSVGLVVENPYLAYAVASQLFEYRPAPVQKIHPSAIIGNDAVIHDTAVIGAHVVIERGVEIGEGSMISSNCSIGHGVKIGDRAKICSNVVLYAGVVLGNDCEINSGSVIGSPGFGFAPDERGRFHPIAQLGAVVIGNKVRLGAGVTIDRGALGNTVIEDGVKVDDQVHIGHNCHVGEDTIICGCAGMAGGTVIGKNCVIAGGVGIGGKGPITFCDSVTVTAMSAIRKSINIPGTYSSGTAQSEHGKWLRNALSFNRLGELTKKILSRPKGKG